MRKLAAAALPRPLPANPEEALLAVMMSALEGNAFMTRRGSTIAASFNLDATPAQTAAAKLALTELGVHGATCGRDVILAAKDLARRGLTPELTPELMAKFQKRKEAYVAARPLADDSLWADLLPSQATDSQSAVGVLVEPSITLNEGRFSFGGKLILAAAARSMSQAGIPFRLVDVRGLGKDKLDPKTTPVLLVCAGGFGVDMKGKDNMAAYSAAGGKLLWIGGEHAKLLGKLSDNLVKADPALSVDHGALTPAAVAAPIHFLGAFKDALGAQPHRFVRNPKHQRPAGKARVAATSSAPPTASPSWPSCASATPPSPSPGPGRTRPSSSRSTSSPPTCFRRGQRHRPLPPHPRQSREQNAPRLPGSARMRSTKMTQPANIHLTETHCHSTKKSNHPLLQAITGLPSTL